MKHQKISILIETYILVELQNTKHEKTVQQTQLSQAGLSDKREMALVGNSYPFEDF